MEDKNQRTKESIRQSVERNQGSPDEVPRINAHDPPTTRHNLAAHLEAFAKAVAEGSSHVVAAVKCGRKRGSASFLYAQPGVRERIAELQTLAKNAAEKAVAENATRGRRQIDIDRNEIVMLLADIARSENQPGVTRVRALAVLSRIYMLEAKSIKDVESFYGWSSDELEEYEKTGRVPVRFRQLLGEGETETADSQTEKASVPAK
jgi:hypothetical protein